MQFIYSIEFGPMRCTKC